MILNELWPLGPNITGYPGGFPNGFLQRMKKRGFLQEPILHVCSGSIKQGTTLDLEITTKPTICADAEQLPFDSETFQSVVIDPPYSKEKALELYAKSLLNVPKAIKEAERVVKAGGFVSVLDLRVWQLGFICKRLQWYALIAIYTANRGPKPLRALQVFRKQESLP